MLPQIENDHRWRALLDTTEPVGVHADFPSGTAYNLQGRSLAMLMQIR